MTIFNFNDLSKQAKIGYNALYNVIFSHSTSLQATEGYRRFTVPLCLNSSNNKVVLTEKNFIFFDSILNELNIFGYYTIEQQNGRAVDDVKTDYSIVSIILSNKVIDDIPKDLKQFNFSDVDTSKLMKRNGKEEKAKTAENKVKEENEKKEAEKTSKALKEKNAEVEMLKKEVAKKDEQLSKKAIDEFNDDALITIAASIEFLVKKHCPIPSDFNFASFENDLFKVIDSHWDLKVLDK